MSKIYNLGIIGCGDYLRWQSDDIKKSKHVRVKSLFDPDQSRAQKFADTLGGEAVATDTAILDDPDIDIVCLFVPPWIRRGIVVRAAAAGKHIITTKPLAANLKDCAAMVKAVQVAKVQCGVFYRRTGNIGIECYKGIFEKGTLGKLALYKQDWLHHYPQWNNWALDPHKNGGPFMDAMIHNLNIARYLAGKKHTRTTLFSDNHAHPGLKCADTEFMKIDFAGGGAAHLFITWAADLHVASTKGNDREHIDITYLITDKGWRLTEAWEDGKFVVTASRDGKSKKFVAKALKGTPYDRFAASVEKHSALPSDIPSIQEAYEDIQILTEGQKKR